MVWDTPNGPKCAHSVAGHALLVISASFSPDGKQIVTVGLGTKRPKSGTRKAVPKSEH